jgi:hypothetical protein
MVSIVNEPRPGRTSRSALVPVRYRTHTHAGLNWKDGIDTRDLGTTERNSFHSPIRSTTLLSVDARADAFLMRPRQPAISYVAFNRKQEKERKSGQETYESNVMTDRWSNAAFAPSG